jgi:hypothetical protein
MTTVSTCYALASGMRNVIRKRAAIAAVVVVLVIGAPAFGQSDDDELFVPSYSLGDQTLSINLGLFVPLFFALGPDGVAPANLSLGAAGSLAWSSYLSNAWMLGIDIGGAFALTPNRRALFMVPITARGCYVIQAYPFEFPISLGVGMNFSRLGDMLKVDPIVKLGGSVLWNHSSQWAFGANLVYWFVPQIYSASSPAGSDATRLGNFLEITLSALYHF